MTDPFAGLVTRTEARGRLGIPGRPFDPVRIGFLVDFWMPDAYVQKMYVEPILLALEEAVAEGHTIRPFELVVERAFALPQNRWENALEGLRGGCTEEAQLMASWLAHRGIRRVGVMSEISPNGQEYFLAFRRAAAELGLEIRGVGTITQTPADLEQRLANLRDGSAEGLAYMGFGFPTALMRPIFERLAWDPPRTMTTAFQFCYASPAWMKALVGWVGIDQVCEENPRYGRFLERFEKHYGYEPSHPNTVPVLAYDSARVLTEAVRRADGVLTGWGVKAGLERTRIAPSCTGGPRTHLGASPDDHNLFHGDWLLYRRVVEARTVFAGTWQPNL